MPLNPQETLKIPSGNTLYWYNSNIFQKRNEDIWSGKQKPTFREKKSNREEGLS